jgi:hypothetical protein
LTRTLTEFDEVRFPCVSYTRATTVSVLAPLGALQTHE